MTNFSAASSHKRPSRNDFLPTRIAVFAVWGTWVGVAFFGIYPTMNWVTSLRTDTHALYFEQELHVPFIPEFIWAYLSMYVLFFTPLFSLDPAELKRLGQELIVATVIAGIVFLLMPAKLGFERALPSDPFYRNLFGSIFAIDRPYNLVPSLHVVYSTAISAAIFLRARLALRIVLAVWLLLLMVSTILVHQHHILDVVTGLLLALVVRHFWRHRNV